MTKIEEIEQLKKLWKASYLKSKKLPFSLNARKEAGIIKGLTLALVVLKQSSNNTVEYEQACSLDHKELRECGANYCIDCGQKLNNE